VKAIMAERFILVWSSGGETIEMPCSTQNQALQRAEALMREHGCDLEIALHLNQTETPSALFNKRRMRDWCLAGFPTVVI
jgi:hypothetical protein